MAPGGGRRRVSDEGGFLSPRESSTLRTLERSLVDQDPRLARSLGGFGARSRSAGVLATIFFVVFSVTSVAALALVIPFMAAVFATPICLVGGVLAVRIKDGPRARRRELPSVVPRSRTPRSPAPRAPGEAAA